MCYNAANHWQLGWFADRAITVDMFKPTLIKIAAFAHYDKTTEGEEYVVVRSGNVYMHYNRATGVNVDTTEYKDHLTIYQAISDGTFLFAALDYETKPLYQRSFSQGTWHAEICDQVFGDGYNTPDYLLVSTGFGESLCSQQVQTKYVSNGLSITVSTSSSSSTLQKSVGQSRVRGGESRALSEINFVQ